MLLDICGPNLKRTKIEWTSFSYISTILSTIFHGLFKEGIQIKVSSVIQHFPLGEGIKNCFTISIDFLQINGGILILFANHKMTSNLLLYVLRLRYPDKHCNDKHNIMQRYYCTWIYMQLTPMWTSCVFSCVWNVDLYGTVDLMVGS